MNELSRFAGEEEEEECWWGVQGVVAVGCTSGATIAAGCYPLSMSNVADRYSQRGYLGLSATLFSVVDNLDTMRRCL